MVKILSILFVGMVCIGSALSPTSAASTQPLEETIKQLEDRRLLQLKTIELFKVFHHFTFTDRIEESLERTIN